MSRADPVVIHRAMRIGELAAAAGVSSDTLRFYERDGLLKPAQRTASGYRLYDRSAVEHVAFIRKAQALGLTLREVREILRVAAEGTRPCAHVRTTLKVRLKDVEARMAELVSLRETLARALQRSRALPVATSCVCEIIESETLVESTRRSPRKKDRL